MFATHRGLKAEFHFPNLVPAGGLRLAAVGAAALMFGALLTIAATSIAGTIEDRGQTRRKPREKPISPPRPTSPSER